MRDDIPPKPLVRLGTELKTPPLTESARIEAGHLLRRIQEGESIGMPRSRPMPSIGARCHELRIRDENQFWRVIYRIDGDAIVVVSVFSKTTKATPKREIDVCKTRLAQYDRTAREAERRGGR